MGKGGGAGRLEGGKGRREERRKGGKQSWPCRRVRF